VTGEMDFLACKQSVLNPIGVTGTADLTLQGSMESRPQSMPVESSVAGGDGGSGATRVCCGPREGVVTIQSSLHWVTGTVVCVLSV